MIRSRDNILTVLYAKPLSIVAIKFTGSPTNNFNQTLRIPQKYIFHICYHDAMWLVPALEIWLGAGPDFDQHGEITTYYLSLLYKPKEMEFLGALAYFYRKMA